MKNMKLRLGRAYKNRVFVIAVLASLYFLALSGLALAQDGDSQAGQVCQYLFN